jgi:tRNA-2-methylthio-N6-dimethylallyladenosine synthase
MSQYSFTGTTGSDRILELMKRKYSREWYLNRIAAIRRILPNCSITTDIFAGFCSETEEDHQQSLSLMREVGYDMAFMFKYSERPGTFAASNLPDDVPEAIKIRRLNEIIALQGELSLASNKKDIGKEFEVLVEAFPKEAKNTFWTQLTKQSSSISKRRQTDWGTSYGKNNRS